jgi:hypothetical protein
MLELAAVIDTVNGQQSGNAQSNSASVFGAIDLGPYRHYMKEIFDNAIVATRSKGTEVTPE